MTQQFKFFPSSPQASKIVKKDKYPWVDCPDGCSFGIERSEVKLTSLISLASKMGRKLGCKFTVVDHGEGPYEVARRAVVKSVEKPVTKTIVDVAKESS